MSHPVRILICIWILDVIQLYIICTWSYNCLLRIFIIINQIIGLMSRVLANGLGNRGSILGWIIPETQKWYLILPCLTLSIIKYRSRVKWSNPEEGVVPSPTTQCSSYWKGSLQVNLDCGRQLLLLLLLLTTWDYIIVCKQFTIIN